LPFEILMRAQPTMSTVTDDELIECMRLFAGYMKIVVEPTGCLGFAAVRRRADEVRGQRVGVIISGGNVDLHRFAAFVGTVDT
jgi:threonine dehydratase